MPSTISGTVNNGITLGSSQHPSPLTITSSGEVTTSSGVAIAGSGTLYNEGLVHTTSIASYAVSLSGSAFVDNSGTIESSSGGGIHIKSGTVINSGRIVFSRAEVDYGVLVASGALTNAPGGYISGGAEVQGNVYNYGSIVDTYTTGSGVYLTNGGSVHNTGSLQGAKFGVGDSAGGTIYNSGRISGGTDGVRLYVTAGTVVNSGTITGASRGVYLSGGGVVTNRASGYISGIEIGPAAGYVLNAGKINSTAGIAIDLAHGGTIVDAGTVRGATTAIYLGGTDNNLLELDPGYAIAGSVVAKAAATNLLELESGSGTGTVSGLGSKFAGFQTVTIASGAQWSLTGSNTIGSGVTLDNEGVLDGESTLASGGYLDNAGTLANNATGGVAVYGVGGAVSFSNAGSIEATASSAEAIKLTAGGSIDNGGYIHGASYGILIEAGAGTVTNLGTVEGGFGIFLKAGGTVIDAGKIGGAGEAVYLGGSGSNVLELEAGYSLSGVIAGAAGASNTLELSSTLGGVSVSYDSLGLVHFGFTDFAAPSAGDETLVITDSLALPGTIEGFSRFNDIIDLRQLTDPGAAVFNLNTVTDQLTITEGTQAVTLQLAGNLSGNVWQAGTDGFGGTDVEPACFAQGTLILTENGERPVEELKIGDKVVTYSRRQRPIKWIGRRSYRGAFLLRNSEMWPICIKAGALGDGTPRRDLHLSARHALFLDGLLIPVECLVNGSSVVRCGCPDTVEYFHIELSSHDVILAEGAPAESFVDCDNRGIFHNAHEFALLYPGEGPERWAFCAPRVEAGIALRRVRQRMLARARQSQAAARRGAV
jgi:hypothetical protein